MRVVYKRRNFAKISVNVVVVVFTSYRELVLPIKIVYILSSPSPSFLLCSFCSGLGGLSAHFGFLHGFDHSDRHCLLHVADSEPT